MLRHLRVLRAEHVPVEPILVGVEAPLLASCRGRRAAISVRAPGPAFSKLLFDDDAAEQAGQAGGHVHRAVHPRPVLEELAPCDVSLR